MHPCAADPECPNCNGSIDPGSACDWSFAGPVYCISLKSRDDRVQEVSKEFHRTGLCRHVTFYRPVKHAVKGIIGSWESHRAVMQDALRRGAERALILEDDVLFTRLPTPSSLAAIRRAIERLPGDWMIFHLGHWPLSAYFVHPDVLRTSSACAHAYFASRRLMEWLDQRPWGAPDVKKRLFVGKALDSAYAALPGTYALFPMIAIQRVSRSDNFNARRRRIRKPRHLVTRTRYREVLLSRLMRPSEAVAVALSPVFWVMDTSSRWWRNRQARRA